MTDSGRLFDLSGRTAVVLGAASGIGKSSAEALAALGARVLCADRAADGAEATAAGIREQGGSAEATVCDAADRASVTALGGIASERFSRLDIAVTTPGPHIRKQIPHSTKQDPARVSHLNIQAPHC